MQRLGVEVLAGRARFINQNSVEVSSSATAEKVIFSSRYFVVVTGSRPRVPKFAGSDRVRMLTNESLFELDQLPERLLVLGGGPVGIEMAQTFRRFGSQVTLVNRAENPQP